MTKINEMTNAQARARHRTTAHMAELGLQSAEDYHQRYLHKASGKCRHYSQYGADASMSG
jgi:peptide methionine sulfoxide reductase MsrA